MSGSSYRIVVVSDNKARSPLQFEHGFSLWIEVGSRKVLLDCGQGMAFRENAGLLGLKTVEIDKLVLSHGHYDHAGSVEWVLRKASAAEVYLHPAAFLPRYSMHSGTARPVQMPGESMSSIIAHPDGLVHWTSSVRELGGGIGVTGPVPRRNGWEDTGGGFYLDTRGKKEDPIRDDMSLWFTTDEGLVICTGCCHSGIVNTLQYIIEITGEKKVRMVIGGLHLLNAGVERLEKTVAALNQMDIKEIYPCHCTGDRAVKYLSGHLAFPVIPGYAGLEIKSG